MIRADQIKIAGYAAVVGKEGARGRPVIGDSVTGMFGACLPPFFSVLRRCHRSFHPFSLSQPAGAETGMTVCLEVVVRPRNIVPTVEGCEVGSVSRAHIPPHAYSADDQERRGSGPECKLVYSWN